MSGIIPPDDMLAKKALLHSRISFALAIIILVLLGALCLD